MAVPQNWLILSDSQAALASTKHTINAFNDSLVYETLKALTRASEVHHIVFQWIPGHCNIPGNAAADVAARQAHQFPTSDILPLYISDLRHILTRASDSLCHATWFDERSQSSLLFKVDPLLRFQIPTPTSRCLETLIHRLRIGTAYTKHFLHKIGKVQSARCLCGHPDETIHHVILECPRHDDARRNFKSVLMSLDNRPFNLAKVLGPWTTPSQRRRSFSALKLFLETALLGLY